MKKNRILAGAFAVMMFVCCTVFAEMGSWTCAVCGTENSSAFCTECGTGKPETVACPNCGETYPADTKAVYCINCGAKLRQEEQIPARLEGDGFDTPEDAVRFYLEGLKNRDFGQMLRAFAWETQAEHFSAETKLRRVRSYTPAIKPRMPGDADMIRTANMYSLYGVQIDALYQALETYLLQEEQPNLTTGTGIITFKEDAELEEFIGRYGNDRIEKLAGLTNIRFLTPDEVTGGMFSMGKNPENYLKMNAMYGADETVDVPAVADLGEGIIFCCPTAARYGEKWYLVTVSSMTNMILAMEASMQAFVYARGSLTDYLK